MVGPPELLLRIWALIDSKGPLLGLRLNPAKCEWTWLDPSDPRPSPIRNVPLTPLDGVSILGVPLGSPLNCSSFVGASLLPAFSGVVEHLVDFEDSQSALFLLRASFSSVRATHFMRTTPLPLWSEVATAFDAKLRLAAESIVGFPFPSPAYTQAALTPRLGGLGLRRVVDHADVALAASRYSSSLVCGEVWSPPPPLSPSQHEASRVIDEAIYGRLLASAPDRRERQRLARLACEHAGAWISAVPSSLDGTDTIFPPRTFRVAVALRLGVPVLPSAASCSLHAVLRPHGRPRLMLQQDR